MTGPGAPWPTGATRLAAVIGHPVRHSLSPVLFNAAFRAAGLDWAYAAFDVAPGDGEAAVRTVRTLGLAGLSVTMPHKQAAAAACDLLTPAATALGAVNCVALQGDGTLLGDSTDGPGFLAALRAAGHDPSARRVALLGAGGAARAIAQALGAAGVADLAVLARRPDAAAAAAALAGAAGRPGSVDDLRAADVVCNATSVGMAGTAGAGATPVDPAFLHAGQVVVDIVYHPLQTPLLAAASGIGARTVDGIGMLVHQAAIAFEGWTGTPAPVAAMSSAAAATVGSDRRGR